MSPEQIVALLSRSIGRPVRFECTSRNYIVEGYVGNTAVVTSGNYLFITIAPMVEQGNTVGLPSSDIEPQYHEEYMVFEYTGFEGLSYQLTLHYFQ